MCFTRKPTSWAIAFLCVVTLSIGAQATTLRVRCSGNTVPSKINDALKLLNPAGPNTLKVVGTCNENVFIQGFNRLTLIADPTATINDASGGTDIAVNIDDSTDITLQGFTVTGGVIGVLCGNFSVCRFEGNTIQGASVAGVQAYQSRASFETNTIQNNANGLVSLESSSVRSNGGLIIQQNQGSGVIVDTGGSFHAFSTTIRDNSSNGIDALNHGSVLLLATTVTGNSANGVNVTGHSAADFEVDNAVTGNGADGVVVKDVSFADFRGANTIIGNGSGRDVDCQPKFPATRGALANIGGGTTNCVEP